MYAVGDTHSHMFPVGDAGAEEDLCHVRSGGHSGPFTVIQAGGVYIFISFSMLSI